MLEPLVSRVTALEAQGIVNEFLSDRLPDRFTADQGVWQRDFWVVPVILAYPGIGSVGMVGSVVDYTAIEEMKRVGMEVYQVNRDAIEAAFL
jgi:hypothetical protein